MSRVLTTLAVLWLMVSPAWAQSQAINGNIEGVVLDTSGAVVPGVMVTVTNRDTGESRSALTDDSGLYRAALLPLGTYSVKAELSGFKTVDRSGVTLSAGQTARVNFDLTVGAVSEVLQVTADAPVTDPGAVDLGRTITEEEVKNLPNVARNPYNFALLQPNVTGYENEEFGAARMNANGSQMRTNYQIDGSSATQKDRAGLRMFQPSEIMVREVKVITSGFAPEFGQTTGMVYNAVTPSGSNQFHGEGSYRLRRKALAARPFLLAPTARQPNTEVNNFTAVLGGPIARDKAFFYVGYERLVNDLSSGRVITVTPQTATTLGLSSAALGEGVIPAVQHVDMFIAKTDVQFNASNRFSARWLLFKNYTPENVGGALNTREVAVDFQDRMDSLGAQLVSTLGTDKLNELRIAYGRRDNPTWPSDVSGPGPAVVITGVANFGASPTRSEFVEDFTQIVDNFTWFRGRHSLKAGLDFQFIKDTRQSDIVGTYTFPNVDAYLAAKNNTNPFGYTRFAQNVGDPGIEFSQRYYSFFVQDDFQVTPAFKLIYGVRYDLFKVPEGIGTLPFEPSHTFEVDKNNFGPRVGMAWALDKDAQTVLRASTGVMYESPLGMFYQDALQESGAPKLLSVSVTPTQTGAPTFPGLLDSLPPGIVPSRTIRAVDDEFKTQWALLTNVQLERALTADLTGSIGYVNSTGRNLPVLLNSNVRPTGQTLPDGRPIYSRTISPDTRLFPAFDRINLIQSTGTSPYNALTMSVEKRSSRGYQAQASYTLAKAQDDGVIGSRYVIGSTDLPALSDPSDQSRDYSLTSWNVTHTFVLSSVIAPQVSGDGMAALIANHNQLGLIFQANSGLPFNIRSNLDLNLDDISADRPNGVARNGETLGRFVNVDLRYSRFIPFGNGRRGEVFFEAKNVFNHANVRAVNSVVTTDTTGNPSAPIPTAVCEASPTANTSGCFPVTQTYLERQMQVGLRFTF